MRLPKWIGDLSTIFTKNPKLFGEWTVIQLRRLGVFLTHLPTWIIRLPIELFGVSFAYFADWCASAAMVLVEVSEQLRRLQDRADEMVGLAGTNVMMVRHETNRRFLALNKAVSEKV